MKFTRFINSTNRIRLGRQGYILLWKKYFTFPRGKGDVWRKMERPRWNWIKKGKGSQMFNLIITKFGDGGGVVRPLFLLLKNRIQSKHPKHEPIISTQRKTYICTWMYEINFWRFAKGSRKKMYFFIGPATKALPPRAQWPHFFSAIFFRASKEVHFFWTI